MSNLNVTASDIPKLKRLEELKVIMNKLQHLADNREDKVVYAGKTWNYESLVLLAHEYYVLGRPYNLVLGNFEKWLENEKHLLDKHNLPWPV